jgi:hypothetical protein
MSKEKLKLHQGQIDSVKSFIKSFQFSNESLAFTNYSEFEALDESLLTNKVLQDNFDTYDIGMFIQNLTWELLSSAEKDVDKRKKLFKSEDWLTNCTKKIIDIIESTPLEYTGSISLPALTTQFIVNFDITSKISITTSPELSNNNLLVSALMGAKGHSYYQTRLLSKTPYINIKTKGYCNGNINSSASYEFLSSLKQLLALTLILRLITADKLNIGFLTGQTLRNSDKSTTPHWLMETSFLTLQDSKHLEVPPELGAFINSINLNTDNLSVFSTDPNANTILGSVVKKTPENDNEFNDALVERFQKITAFFKLTESIDKKRISSALEWFLEAKITANQSVSLIYFCIGLEAILGDDSKNKELQIKEKLADRVAYMLGNTSSQRIELKNDFKAIYSARSDLIHAKEPKISKQNIELLGKAEILLSFLITRELNGLMKSEK